MNKISEILDEISVKLQLLVEIDKISQLIIDYTKFPRFSPKIFDFFSPLLFLDYKNLKKKMLLGGFEPAPSSH